jgi:transcriptional regulator with XRE-family HTH domain
LPAPKLTMAARTTMGARFASARLARGLAQSEVAEALGISTSAVAHLERGRNVPSAPTLLLAADLFRCTTDWLLGRGAR